MCVAELVLFRSFFAFGRRFEDGRRRQCVLRTLIRYGGSYPLQTFSAVSNSSVSRLVSMKQVLDLLTSNVANPTSQVQIYFCTVFHIYLKARHSFVRASFDCYNWRRILKDEPEARAWSRALLSSDSPVRHAYERACKRRCSIDNYTETPVVSAWKCIGVVFRKIFLLFPRIIRK